MGAFCNCSGRMTTLGGISLGGPVVPTEAQGGGKTEEAGTHLSGAVLGHTGTAGIQATAPTSNSSLNIKKKAKKARKKKGNSGAKKPVPVKEESPSDYHSSEDEVEENEVDEGRGGYRKGGYHPVKEGEWYKHRYQIKKKLGWGHFSTVWLAQDSKTGGFVALKIVKSAPHYTGAALDEVELLNWAAKHDPQGEKYVVRLLDHFMHTGPHGRHVVMVFEVLGKNILDLIEKHYCGLPLEVVKSMAYQILVALRFLHAECNIIHTDLKPENILLVEPPGLVERNWAREELQEQQSVEVDVEENPPVTMVKIADLGNACWVDKHFTDDIQTRQYRSPEAIIGFPYGPEADIWSFACIVFELATGDLLFKPKNGSNHGKSDDHLALMLELLGRKTMPKRMVQLGKRSKEFFNMKGELRLIKKLKFWLLEDLLIEKYKFSAEDAAGLSEFLLPMLQIDPGFRCSAEEALKHRWLADVDKSVPIPLDTPPSSEEEDDDDDEQDWSSKTSDVAPAEDEKDVDEDSHDDLIDTPEASVPGGE